MAVLILMLNHNLCGQGQAPASITLMKLDELEKLLSANQFETLLDYHSKSPTVKWPKIYSAEFCAERLKGKKQEEALQARKLAEMLFAQLKPYHSKLKGMPLDEFAKTVNKLLDLRGSLSEPGYGNIALQLCIERIVTLHIAERVVARDDDLKILELLMRRNNEWKHEWRTVCQMIEEEEGVKRFDYTVMEKMQKWEVYAPFFVSYDGKNPKLLYGKFDPDSMKNPEEITIKGLLQKRSFNGFLHILFVQEYDGRSLLPGLILFKQRGGNFKEKWKDNFDKLMNDYVDRTDLVKKDLDSDHFAELVDAAKKVTSGDEAPFMFDMSWLKADQKD